MTNKILAFFGLAEDDGDVVVESHRKRSSDYMKKIQRLVVEEEEEKDDAPEAIIESNDDSENEDEPVKGYVAVKDDPLTESESAAPTPAPAPVAEEKKPEEEPKPVKVEEAPTPRARHAEARTNESFTNRLKGFGKSLRRPDEEPKPLILVKKDALTMLDDIEDALVGGQTVLLDFEQEDRQKASEVITRIVNFIRLHKGVFYTVTTTSMLISLNKNAVVEWRSEEGGER